MCIIRHITYQQLLPQIMKDNEIKNMGAVEKEYVAFELKNDSDMIFKFVHLSKNGSSRQPNNAIPLDLLAIEYEIDTLESNGYEVLISPSNGFSSRFGDIAFSSMDKTEAENIGEYVFVKSPVPYDLNCNIDRITPERLKNIGLV